MNLGSLKIGTRLIWGFGLVVFFGVVAGIVTLFGMQHLADLTEQMYHHPLTVSNSVRDVRANINAMHRSMKDVALAKNLEEIESASKIVDEYEQDVFKSFDIIFERFLGDQGDVKSAHKAFSDWKPIRDEVIQLSLLHERDKAIEITKGKGARHVAFMSNKIQIMIDFASHKGDSFFEDAQNTRNLVIRNTFILLAVMFITSIIVALLITRSITVPVREIVARVEDIAKGDLEHKVDIHSKDEIGKLSESVNQVVDNFSEVVRQANTIAAGDYSTNIAPRSEKDGLGSALQDMTKILRDVSAENEKQHWLKTGQTQLNDTMRGDLDVRSLSRKIIIYLSKYLGAQIGAIYIADENSGVLKLTGSYAFTKQKDLNSTIKIGEGLVGQSALEKEMISVLDVPENYIRVSSATGDAIPRNIIVTPFIYEGNLTGVIELGSFKEFSDRSLEFLKTVMENIAIVVNSADARTKMKELLEETQRQAEELQTQQEELRAANEELEEKTQSLMESEKDLKTQQEELQVTNEELEEKTESLLMQKADIQKKNIDLERARQELEEKAEELSITSKYKSEFLANMSHELRTPLNSLLLLARILIDNKDGNLSNNQIESAKVIHSSGCDLLHLINEILDLSKVEAGQMNVETREILVSDLKESVKANFQHWADEKGLDLRINIDKNLQASIFTDRKRLEQIIKNLMSNAVKFTNEGSITVEFVPPSKDVHFSRSGLVPEESFAIAVTDTGIGIPPEKHKIIFEAFQQAEGGTARKFGGTGLGLSISRELVKLLGGEIHLKSEPGKGSTFTLYLPIKYKPEVGLKSPARETRPGSSFSRTTTNQQLERRKSQPITQSIPDDRNSLEKGNRTILVIEDDLNFAKILLDQCHEKGFNCLTAGNGEGGLEMAKKYMPNAIILDIKLPDMNGWAVLDTLKDNSELRHIPVHIMSVEESTIDALKKGAIGFLTKPAKKEEVEEAFGKIEEIMGKNLKDLLVVEDDKNLRKGIAKLIGNGDVKITEATSGKEAIAKLESNKYDCVVLDLGLPDMSGFELLKKLEKKKNFVIPPIIIFTGKELTKEEELELRKYSETIIIKGVKSEERLLDETALFLHRIIDNMPRKKQQMIIDLHDKDIIFNNKKILLVDDDMRSSFALSEILQQKGMKVLKAEDGQKALKILGKESDIDLVLMDVMMPGMDGYETTQKIRKQKKFIKLPVIALTAKAMKDDRGKCLAAGANDYLAKPVEVNRLLSMMRVWMYQ